MEEVVDDVFNMKSNSAMVPEPFQRPAGELRPAARAALAAMIMYHKERWDQGEMISVLAKLEKSVSSHLHASPVEGHNITSTGSNDARQTLFTWGKRLRTQFDLDNLHLTARQQADGMDQLVTAVHSGFATVAANMTATHKRLDKMDARFQEVYARLQALDTRSASPASRALQQQPAGGFSTPLPSSASSDGKRAREADDSPPTVKAARGSDESQASGSGMVQAPTDTASKFGSLQRCPPGVIPGLAAQVALPTHAVDLWQAVLTGDIKLKDATVPDGKAAKQRLSEARCVYDWYVPDAVCVNNNCHSLHFSTAG